jgi:hypothetical protein
MSLVIAIVAWAALAFVVFVCVLLVDEDVNHWNWSGNGPSAFAYARFFLLSGFIAAIPVAGVAWLLTH